MQKIEGIPVWGSPVDEGAFTQLEKTLEHEQAIYGALMADHHKGYGVPIGGVVAYMDAISPTGVGYDIGCGNKAVRLDIPVEEVRDHIHTIMDDIAMLIPFGMGHNHGRPVEHPIFDKEEWKELPMMTDLREAARYQLGTVGGGNHYVDLFVDEQNRVWVGCHFGSRGLGHKTATWFLKAGRAKDSMDAEPLVFSTQEDLGVYYVHAMQLAGEYAYAGRDLVCQTIAEYLDAHIMQEVHNHHNFAWKETHYGIELWVVRKGSTPNAPGQVSFVGGSMGDVSYILQGVNSYESRESLYSTVHGAGRVMSRTAAKGKFNRKTGEQISEGRISQGMMSEYLSRLGVVLKGGDLDEAPQAYKRIEEVIEHHKNTVEILHTLTPMGVIMAGKDVFDPYKD